MIEKGKEKKKPKNVYYAKLYIMSKNKKKKIYKNSLGRKGGISENDMVVSC